jgi:hypothetical protein
VRTRKTPLLVWLMVCWCSVAAATPAKSDPTEHQDACHPAELFATDNTAVITDPNMDSAGQLQDGLGLFEIQADVTIAQNGAAVTGSTLLDGVHWSNTLQQNTYERSREFHLCRPDELTLHTLAEALRRQFNQEAVLTFDYLPQNAPGANAIAVTVPNIDIARFRDAFVADSAAHHRLHGGSVTTTDHALILIATTGDLDVARRLVGAAGGSWDAATIAYGRREFATSLASSVKLGSR